MNHQPILRASVVVVAVAAGVLVAGFPDAPAGRIQLSPTIPTFPDPGVDVPTTPPTTAATALPALKPYQPAQSMPVPTMRAEYTVRGFQMSTDCRGNRLLTYVRVTGAMHQTSLMTARQLLLGLTDDLHGPIQFEHRVRRHEREFPEW